MKDDLRELVDAAAEVCNFLGDVFADGKISLSDAGALVSHGPALVTSVGAALEGKENLKLADLYDAGVRAEAVARFKEKCELAEDVLEEQVEAFIEAVAAVFGFVALVLPKGEGG